MYSVNVTKTEKHCLKIILIDVKGAQIFNELKTFNGVSYATFKAAAIVRNLLADDSAWIDVMEQDSTYQMPVELRHLFSNIFLNRQPSTGLQLRT